VNVEDRCWREQFFASANIPLPIVRYRDWGLLRYLFRGIEKNCPFFEKVFLVVSNESQVPNWVDRTTVQIVLHKDFIPEEFLPLFNSSSIEVFLPKILGLGEEFVYFNDDMFPVGRTCSEDFFCNGKALNEISRKISGFKHEGVWKSTVLSTLRLSEKAAGVKMDEGVACQKHSVGCLLRSVCEEAYKRVEADLHSSISKVREERNVNFYFYTNYQYLVGKGENRGCGLCYLTSSSDTQVLIDSIKDPKEKIVCINDTSTPRDFEEKKEVLKRAFEEVFPCRSKYEKL